MKKHILAIVALSTAFGVNAQIFISNSDMPVSGSSSTITTALPTSIDLKLGETGANHTWDYTNLSSIDEDVVVYEKATDISSVYIFFGLNAFGKKVFDAMTFGAVTIEDVYDFYKGSSSNFKAVGRGISFNGQAIPSFFTDDDIIYQFPLSYGDNNTDDFEVIFTLPGLITLNQSGTRTTTVDGWGKVTTPYKTYDCIRVMSVVDQVNAVKLSSFPEVEFPVKMVEYKWLAKGEVIPVLKISGTELAGNFIPDNVSYRSEDPKVSLPDITAGELAVYPNPASDQIKIRTDYNLLNITIVDATGKQVYEGNSNTIDITQFEKGIYFVKIETDNGTFVRKVVKQ